jgi:hypothetical protein
MSSSVGDQGMNINQFWLGLTAKLLPFDIYKVVYPVVVLGSMGIKSKSVCDTQVCSDIRDVQRVNGMEFKLAICCTSRPVCCYLESAVHTVTKQVGHALPASISLVSTLSS